MRRIRWTGERSFRVSRRTAGASLVLLVSLAHAESPGAVDAPRRLGLEDSVAIGLTQIEVTAWPDDPESDACVGLRTDDFELFVEGKPRPIYAVDAIGSETEAARSLAPARDAPGLGGGHGGLDFSVASLDPAKSASAEIAFD